ncbi:hypothetical protein GCM10020255_003340 [Rhodococcus baikonurensis]
MQRDLARQALIPENLTWIFPAIVDSAILGSTMAIVLISKLKMNRRDRGFYISLAVSVVVISILGNAFHAYNAAVDARTFVAGGETSGSFHSCRPLRQPSQSSRRPWSWPSLTASQSS